jgi:hypothetical protein
VRENHPIGRDRDAITSRRGNRFAAGSAGCVWAALRIQSAYKLGSRETFSRTNSYRLSGSVPPATVELGRRLPLPGLRFAFRAMKIDETSLLYRCTLRSTVRFRGMFRAQRLPVAVSTIHSNYFFQPGACRTRRRARSDWCHCRACHRCSIRATNRTVCEK